MKTQNEEKVCQIASELMKGQLKNSTTDEYETGKQYAGYLVINEDGSVCFRKKERRVYRNGFVTIRTNDDFTIQKNDKYVKVTMVLDKESLTFQGFMTLLTRLSLTMDNLKLLPL